GLVSLAPNYGKIGADSAFLVSQILLGARPSNLPRLHPTGTLVINTTTAESLGLTLSKAVIESAQLVQ
ncbi:MAG: ABC transporter substrate binding protein, partial [Deltaproteobacteria bacterium]